MYKQKIKLKYLEKSLRELGVAYNIGFSQSMLNLGKQYSSFTNKENIRSRLLNCEASCTYLLNTFKKSRAQEEIEKQMAILQHKLQLAIEETMRCKRGLLNLGAKIQKKRREVEMG